MLLGSGMAVAVARAAATAPIAPLAWELPDVLKKTQKKKKKKKKKKKGKCGHRHTHRGGRRSRDRDWGD